MRGVTPVVAAKCVQSALARSRRGAGWPFQRIARASLAYGMPRVTVDADEATIFRPAHDRARSRCASTMPAGMGAAPPGYHRQSMEERLERTARNEALVREVNERVEELDAAAEARGWVPDDGLFDFYCECGREGGCSTKIALTLEEYERVRGQDDRFALAPGHETPGLERVVEQNDRFVDVDKAPAAEAFVADDPRGVSSQ
jgi:hypothetical protein